jgi:hypothetical protein
MVDEDPNNTCSYGLHVANWDYAYNNYGGKSDIMLEVEVDPADVVAIPVDYNQSKMRVCKYKVINVVSQESSFPLRNTNLSENVDNTSDDVENNSSNYNDEDYYDDDDYEGDNYESDEADLYNY